MNIVLLGSPGSGKSFVGGRLEKSYGLAHISTGGLLRKNTELLKAHGIDLSDGNLVSDELVFEVLKVHMENNPASGYVLDGIPRTLTQTGKLEEVFNVDLVLYLDVTDETVYDRLLNRLVCSKCNMLKPVSAEKDSLICTFCGGKLVRRSDDGLETIKHRIAVFRNHSEQLKQYYTRQNKLVVINANLSPEKVFEQVKNAYEAVISGDN